MTTGLDRASTQKPGTCPDCHDPHSRNLPDRGPDVFEQGVRDVNLQQPFDDSRAACKRCYREGYRSAARITIELPAIGEAIIERDSGARGTVTRIMPNTIWFRLEDGMEDFNIPEVFWDTFRRGV